MRELTDAEYRAAQAILSQPGSTEGARIRTAGLSPSTYHVARRRIFSEGWLGDVLLPSPGPLGFSGVEFQLVRPPVAQRSALLEAWAPARETVLLWAGLHSVFGIFFRRGSPGPGSKGPENGGGPPVVRLLARAGSGEVPVYFDYSGLWARFGGEATPAGYPMGLDLSSEPADARSAHAAARALTAQGGPGRRPGMWSSLAKFSRAERRALERGLLQSRTVIDPARVPPLDGRRLGEFLFVSGELRTEGRATELLGELTGSCRTFPLLFASAGRRVLLVGLGQTSSRTPGRAPVPAAQGSVLGTIERHLDRTEVVVEPVESVRRVVDHRYPAPTAEARVRSGPTGRER